jgi:hypothetical protein
MQKESCNKFLTEWMGECWHKFTRPEEKWVESGSVCKKCGKEVSTDNVYQRFNYFTPEGFFLLWNKANEGGSFYAFLYKEWGSIEDMYIDRVISLINPEIFPYKWARFLGWKEVK